MGQPLGVPVPLPRRKVRHFEHFPRPVQMAPPGGSVGGEVGLGQVHVERVVVDDILGGYKEIRNK